MKVYAKNFQSEIDLSFELLSVSAVFIGSLIVLLYFSIPFV